MGEKKDIEEFQARFLMIINSLAYLGENIENWRQVNKVLQSLNSSWDPIVIHFQAIFATKDLDIDTFFGKLSVFQGLQKRKVKPEVFNEKNLALKVEKALKKMGKDYDSDEDEGDKELALVTKNLKKF